MRTYDSYPESKWIPTPTATVTPTGTQFTATPTTTPTTTPTPTPTACSAYAIHPPITPYYQYENPAGQVQT